MTRRCSDPTARTGNKAGATRLLEYLAIPHVAVFYSVEGADGEWRRRAEYPELPGCAAEADTVAEALQLLEDTRVRYIRAAIERGEEPPTPRPPLSCRLSGITGDTLSDALDRTRPRDRPEASGANITG